jgi:hypothetical protein
MGKALYSEGHDRKREQPERKKRTAASEPEPTTGEIVFSQTQLSEEQRRQLRQRQLESAGKVTARGPDSWRRQKKLPKGPGGQGLPTVNVPGSDTLARPPDYSKRKINVLLGDPDITPVGQAGLQEIERKVRWRRTHKHKKKVRKSAKLPRLASGLSALDDSLGAVNRDVIDIDTTLNNLLDSARELEARAGKSGDPQVINATQMIRDITERALIGWVEVIKDYMKDLLGGTDEAVELQQNDQLPEDVTPDANFQPNSPVLPQTQPQTGNPASALAANRRRRL